MLTRNIQQTPTQYKSINSYVEPIDCIIDESKLKSVLLPQSSRSFAKYLNPLNIAVDKAYTVAAQSIMSL
jgi:hypothetical protein